MYVLINEMCLIEIFRPEKKACANIYVLISEICLITQKYNVHVHGVLSRLAVILQHSGCKLHIHLHTKCR